jgi:hypothetical protein
MHTAFSFGELHLSSHIINLWHSETEKTGRGSRADIREHAAVWGPSKACTLQSYCGHAALDTAAETHAFRRPEGLTW